MSSEIGTDIIRIAERFRIERERIGYSQAAAARALAISREALRNLENGQSDFKISILASASQLGMDAQFILTGVRSPNLETVEKASAAQIFTMNGGRITGAGMVGQGGVVNVIETKQHVTRFVARTDPGEEHISIEQRHVLKGLVEEVAEAEAKLSKSPRSHRAIWSALNAHCKTTSYTLIKKEDFEKARKYLHQWLGRLNSGKLAPVVDGEKWLQKKYAYIKINTKDPEDAAALAAYMKRNFSAESLTELSNDELEQAYRYVAGRRNRRR